VRLNLRSREVALQRQNGPAAQCQGALAPACPSCPCLLFRQGDLPAGGGAEGEQAAAARQALGGLPQTGPYL
jgi:hypothetical protein